MNSKKASFFITVMIIVAVVAPACRADIIYSANTGGDSHLFRVDPDTGDEEQITYTSYLDRWNLNMVDPDQAATTRPENLIELLWVHNGYPTVSRDGRRVAYASLRKYRDEGLRQWDPDNGWRRIQESLRVRNPRRNYSPEEGPEPGNCYFMPGDENPSTECRLSYGYIDGEVMMSIRYCQREGGQDSPCLADAGGTVIFNEGAVEADSSYVGIELNASTGELGIERAGPGGVSVPGADYTSFFSSQVPRDGDVIEFDYSYWQWPPLYPQEYYLYFYSYFPTTPYFTRHKSLNWNIYMTDLETGGEWQISNFLWKEFDPQFLPRGSDVLYVLKAEQSYFVLRGPKSGKSFKQITLKDNQAQAPQVSPDGRTLVYHSFRNNNWDLYILPMKDLPSERIETRLTATTYVNELHPHWSPDGGSIVYIANRPGRRSYYDLCVMDMQTGESEYITDDMNINPDAVFSPDGELIAFTSNERGSFALYVMQPDGKGRRRLSGGGSSVYFPTWSPDGARIAYIEESASKPGTYSLQVSGADGSGKNKVSTLPAAFSPPAWY